MLAEDYLNAVGDRELGADTRALITSALWPGTETVSAEEEELARSFLRQLVSAWCVRRGSPLEEVYRHLWPDNSTRQIVSRSRVPPYRDIQLVVAVLRRKLQGQTIEQACNELAHEHTLPIDSRYKGAALAEVVKATFKRARKRLGRYSMSRLEQVVRVKRVHQGLDPESALPEDLWFLEEVRGPVAPPDFPLRGEREPSRWTPGLELVRFLFGEAQRLGRTTPARNKRRSKT
jgi:hypothetical protein